MKIKKKNRRSDMKVITKEGKILGPFSTHRLQKFLAHFLYHSKSREMARYVRLAGVDEMGVTEGLKILTC